MPQRTKIFYERHLPHYQPDEHTFFVTFRTTNSLPLHVIDRLKREYNLEIEQVAALKSKKEKNIKYAETKWNYFKEFDKWLDKLSNNSWLSNERIAKIVYDAILYRNKKEYDLICFTIMANHIHMVFHLDNNTSGRIGDSTYIVTKILQDLKKFTARECNKILNRTGSFWQHESYDHVVRNEEELNKIITYFLNNPLKAGLVDNPENWSWSYCEYLL